MVARRARLAARIKRCNLEFAGRVVTIRLPVPLSRTGRRDSTEKWVAVGVDVTTSKPTRSSPSSALSLRERARPGAVAGFVGNPAQSSLVQKSSVKNSSAPRAIRNRQIGLLAPRRRDEGLQ